MRSLIPGVVSPLHIALLRAVTEFMDGYDAALGVRLDGGTALSANCCPHSSLVPASP